MKRLIVILVALVLLLSVGIYTGVSADDALKIKVGVYENQPKIFTDDEGNAAGFWPEITRYIAQQEGWEIEWVHGTWMECLERLERNEIDIMPDVAYTGERDERFDFSLEPVYVSWSRVYSKEDIDIFSILDLEGKNIAVLAGSVNYIGPDGIKTLTDALDVHCTFIEVDSYVRVFELIDSKEADAGVVSKDFAYLHIKDFNVIETAIIFQPALLYFAFPTESTLKPLLITTIDNTMRELKADGESAYYQSLKYWMGASPLEKPVFPDWLKWMLIGIGAIALVLGGGTLLLRIQVNKRTKELRESEEKLALILETVPHGLSVFDTDGKITQVNRAALEMGGYHRRDLVGRKCLDFVSQKDRKRAELNLRKTFEIGLNRENEYVLVRKDGSEFPAKLYTALYKDSSGNPGGIVAIVEDITLLKQAEEEHKKVIEYRELDRLRTSLLSTVSHELRTPLAGIKGYATLLLEYYNKLKKAQKWESLEAIDRSTDRLTDLIDHLLDMSRLDAGLLRLDLHSIQPRDIFLAAVTEAKIRSPKSRIKTKINYRMPNVNADARRLRQVIDNLLDNAIKYSPEGSEIKLMVEARPEELQISVTDCGSGIPDIELDKIFDRFYRIEERLEKDPGGLGLGLSLCKALVEAHEGRIWVESQEGKGSTFYFTVPLKKEKA